MARSKVCLVLVVVLAVYILLMIIPVNAQVERIATSCNIFVDDVVEGQPITATLQMSPATPTGESYTQLIVYLKSPNGVGASSPNGPWVYTNISTDPNGKATITFDVPTYSGKWYVFVDFGGHSYFNYSMFYVGGTWQAGFTVSPITTPTPLPTASLTPLPTNAPTKTPALPNNGSTSPPNNLANDLVATLVLIAVAIIVISVFSLLLYVRHLRKRIPEN